MKRPLWLGAGVAIGVSGTLWAELRLRRWGRRAMAALGPVFTGGGGDERTGRPFAALARRAEQAGARPQGRVTSAEGLGTALRRAAMRRAARAGIRVARAAIRAALAPGGAI